MDILKSKQKCVHSESILLWIFDVRKTTTRNIFYRLMC